MTMDLKTIQNNLLAEAKASPNLLSDLAGLEEYIAETYSNRSFIELLQNADDAGATKFYISKFNDSLIVANNGRKFSEDDIISLCRSASSSKTNGQHIGYRGIGFKSIVGFAKYVHLISGTYRVTFSKESTFQLIPTATRVPLIRIPHPINQTIKNEHADIINELLNNEYNTIFIFSGLKEFAVAAELESFNPLSLLFLRNILSLKILVNNVTVFNVVKNKINHTLNGDIELIGTRCYDSKWRVRHYKSVSIAFSLNENTVIRIPTPEAFVYAFLPTEDTTDLGVLINGNFSTDPSRRHIIFDELSINSIKEVAYLISSILEEILISSDTDISILDAIIPNSDIKIYQFQKTSFTKLLINEIRAVITDKIADYNIAPSWLNIKDFEQIALDSDLHSINRYHYGIEKLPPFLEFLGAHRVSLQEMTQFNIYNISNLGCMEIVREMIRCSIPSYTILNNRFLDLSVFLCKGIKRSLNEIKKNRYIIDDFFINMLIEGNLSETELKSFFKYNISEEYLSSIPIFQQEINYVSNDYKRESLSNENLSYPDILSTTEINHAINVWLQKKGTKNFQQIEKTRWRSAEIQVREVLNSIGFNLQDVSKQNIGYDLEGTDPNGNNIMIEVKSIKNRGDKFEMTNNEVALAQEKRSKYYIAITQLGDKSIEIMLIPDPINTLSLERQAVQWKWICDNYEFDPIKLNL